MQANKINRRASPSYWWRDYIVGINNNGRALNSTRFKSSGTVDYKVVIFTCVPPNRQVLILLDVQHDLQAVSCPSLHGGAERLPFLYGVEHVALPIPGEHLRGDAEKERAD